MQTSPDPKERREVAKRIKSLREEVKSKTEELKKLRERYEELAAADTSSEENA